MNRNLIRQKSFEKFGLPIRRLTDPMFAADQLPYTCSAAVLMSLQPILVTMSKNEAGRFDYSVPASTMLSEVPAAAACFAVRAPRSD